MDDPQAPSTSTGCTSGTATDHGDDAREGGSDVDVEKADQSLSLRRLEQSPSPVKPQLQPILTSRSTLGASHMNEIMEKLTLEEFRAKLFDEIVEKVKTELTETSRGDSESETVCEVVRSTSHTNASISPKTQPSRPYQATVEDADADFDDNSSYNGGNMTPDSIFAASPISPTTMSDLQTPASSVRSESISSVASGGSVCPARTAPQGDERPSSLRSANPTEQKTKSNVRWSNRRPIVLHNRFSDYSASPTSLRPFLPERTSTDPGLSAVDLKWGQLFDDNGDPTKRFEAVLRGLANYLIAEFNPTDSLVIPPEKLSLFYDRYLLESEMIPFHHIFNCSSKQDFKDLEYLYRDLRCEYHLIQDHVKGRPYIPSLTVPGFRDWMTLLTRAYPDREVKRLGNIVEDLPIEAEGFALNGDRERVPRQLSRHLFPATRHEKIYRFVSGTFADWKKMTGYKEPSASLLSPTCYKPSLRASGLGIISDDPRCPSPSKTEVIDAGAASQRAGVNRASSYTNGYIRTGSASECDKVLVPERRGRQALDLTPPPVGTHNQRKRSPLELFRHREPPGQASSPGSSYLPVRGQARPDDGRPGDRRSREEEYRFLQGRDPRASLDVQPRGLLRDT